jgi:ankyrin repeat protein
VKDEDDRLPIHWAVAYNHMPVVELLVSMKNFDPDVEVRISFSRIFLHPPLIVNWILTCGLIGWIRLDPIDDRGQSQGCRG